MLNCDIQCTIKKREFQTRGIDLKIHDVLKFTSYITGALFDDSDNQIFQIDQYHIRECRYLIWKNTAKEVSFCGKQGDFFHPYLMAWEF